MVQLLPIFTLSPMYEVGNIFDMVTTADITGIDVVINSAAVAGAQMFVKLYSIDGYSFDVNQSTDTEWVFTR